MARVTNKSKAHENKQLWDRANSTDRGKWRSKSQKGYDFYLDEQLTEVEQDSLEEAGINNGKKYLGYLVKHNIM